MCPSVSVPFKPFDQGGPCKVQGREPGLVIECCYRAVCRELRGANLLPRLKLVIQPLEYCFAISDKGRIFELHHLLALQDRKSGPRRLLHPSAPPWFSEQPSHLPLHGLALFEVDLQVIKRSALGCLGELVECIDPGLGLQERFKRGISSFEGSRTHIDEIGSFPLTQNDMGVEDRGWGLEDGKEQREGRGTRR